MTFDRETRGVFMVLSATAAVLIGINLIVNPAGLPAWMGTAGLILALVSAGLWAWTWRQDKAASQESEQDDIIPVSTPLRHEALAAPEVVSEPEPVAAAPEVVSEPEPVAAAPEVVSEPEPVAAAPEVVSEPEPVAAAPEIVSEPEPVAAVPEVVSEPEPVAAAPEIVTEPEPVAAAPEVVTEPEPVAAAPEVVSEPEPVAAAPDTEDDFTKIEGIGKYYNEALHKLGIRTFAELAKQETEGLIAQLKANGYRQHPAIPTWAEQAALAAAGDWDGLAALQETLDGGRRTEG